MDSSDEESSENESSEDEDAAGVVPAKHSLADRIKSLLSPTKPSSHKAIWQDFVFPVTELLIPLGTILSFNVDSFSTLQSVPKLRAAAQELAQVPFFLPEGVLPKDFRASSTKQTSIVFRALSKRFACNSLRLSQPDHQFMTFSALHVVMRVANIERITMEVLLPMVKKYSFLFEDDDVVSQAFRLNMGLSETRKSCDDHESFDASFTESNARSPPMSLAKAFAAWGLLAASWEPRLALLEPASDISDLTVPAISSLAVPQAVVASAKKQRTAPAAATADPNVAASFMPVPSTSISMAQVFPNIPGIRLQQPAGPQPVSSLGSGAEASLFLAQQQHALPSQTAAPSGAAVGALLSAGAAPIPPGTAQPFIPTESAASLFADQQAKARASHPIRGALGGTATLDEVLARGQAIERWLGAKASGNDATGRKFEGAFMDIAWDDGKGLQPSIDGKRFPLLRLVEVNPMTGARSGAFEWMRPAAAAEAIVMHLECTGNGMLASVASTTAQFGDRLMADTPRFDRLLPAFELAENSELAKQVLTILDTQLNGVSSAVPHFGAFGSGALLEEFLRVVGLVSQKNFYATPALVAPFEILSNKLMEEHKRSIPLFQLFQLTYGQFNFLQYDGGFVGCLSRCEENRSMFSAPSKSKGALEKVCQRLMMNESQMREDKVYNRHSPTSAAEAFANFTVLRHLWRVAHGAEIALPIFSSAEDVMRKLVEDISKGNSSHGLQAADAILLWVSSNMKNLLIDFAREWQRQSASGFAQPSMSRFTPLVTPGLPSFSIFGSLWISVSDSWKTKVSLGFTHSRHNPRSNSDSPKSSTKGKKRKTKRQPGSSNQSSGRSQKQQSGGGRKSPAAAKLYTGSKKVERRFAGIALLKTPALRDKAIDMGYTSLGHLATVHDDNTDNHFKDKHPNCLFIHMYGRCNHPETCIRCIAKKENGN